MNEIVNKFLLTGDRFISALHLKQPGLTYSAWRPFTKHCERIQKFKEAGDLNYIYKNELVSIRTYLIKLFLLMMLRMPIVKI